MPDKLFCGSPVLIPILQSRITHCPSCIPQMESVLSKDNGLRNAISAEKGTVEETLDKLKVGGIVTST